MEKTRKLAPFCRGLFDSISIRPCASNQAICPLRATSVTAPEKSFAATWRWIESWIRERRSSDSPTDSGLTVAAARGRPTKANTQRLSLDFRDIVRYSIVVLAAESRLIRRSVFSESLASAIIPRKTRS